MIQQKIREKKVIEEVLILAPKIGADNEEKIEEREIVLKGIQDIERGEVVDHSEIMVKAHKRIEEWKRNGQKPQNFN